MYFYLTNPRILQADKIEAIFTFQDKVSKFQDLPGV